MLNGVTFQCKHSEPQSDGPFVGHVLEFLSGPTPDAFVGRHITVGNFEDRTAQFWANYHIFRNTLLREVNHGEF
jgi:hypothetical protein